jgi:hypothetical protein
MTACARHGCRRDEPLSTGKLAEQRLSLFQIARIEAPCEPAVDWREKLATSSRLR